MERRDTGGEERKEKGELESAGSETAEKGEIKGEVTLKKGGAASKIGNGGKERKNERYNEKEMKKEEVARRSWKRK